MDLPVKLEIFEGPLDLLLHLIRKNEVDIYDIPIALITRQYLDYLELMRQFNISLAGEFLVMASTLTHIKSRMLLPSRGAGQEDEEEDDPRQDLVEQLKEHMRIKAAAADLDARPWLDRDVFAHAAGRREVEEAASGEPELVEATVFDLIEAFRALMATRSATLVMGLPVARVSMEDRMSQILERLKASESVAFMDCFEDVLSRRDLVVSFLAVLELARLGLIRAYQERLDEPEGSSWGTLRLFYQPEEEPEDQA